MQATLVAVCCLSAILNLASSSSNKVTPVVYEITSESQCDQQIDSFQNDPQLMNTLKIVQQQLPPPGCNKLSYHARTFFAAIHQPPQATTRSRLAMVQLCRSTVTWKGLTVEEREAG